MRYLENFRTIANNYDTILCDIWGVLHCGGDIFEGINKVFCELSYEPSELILVSNSGSLSTRTHTNLLRIGLNLEYIDAVVTAGDVLYQALQMRTVRWCDIPIESIYCITDFRVSDWRHLAGINFTQNIDTAQAIVLLHMPEGRELINFEKLITKSIKRCLPLLCANPDKFSPRSDNSVLAPGSLAAKYERQGGNVIYYGKPYQKLYNYITKSILKKKMGRTLVIGDSIEHDFCGANNIGADFLFIESSLHQEEFIKLTSQNLRKFLENSGFQISKKHKFYYSKKLYW